MNILKNLALLSIGLFSFVSSASHKAEKFTVGCAIELIGGPNSTSAKDESTSEVRGASQQSIVRFDLGDYVLQALTRAKIPNGKSFDEFIPTLDVKLIKKGAGVSGQINYVTTPVVANIGENRSVSSFNFLKLNYKDTTYSRIDYTCTMTRIE